MSEKGSEKCREPCLLDELERVYELIKNNEQNKESIIFQDWNGNIRVFDSREELSNYIINNLHLYPHLYMFEAYSFFDADDKENSLDNCPKLDIGTLKKRIKHAKNPMEKKQLEQQLNIAYKDRKMKNKKVKKE